MDNSIPFTFNKNQLRNFQAKIKTSTTHSYNGTPCKEWTGARNVAGYGRFNVNGKNRLAHRVAWVIARGETDKPFVLHHCDNPPCCEELHLFTGTHQDNADDKTAKGRNNVPRGDKNGARLHPESRPRGEYVNTAKIKDAEIPEIFRLRSHGMTYLEIGIVMGVVPSQIGYILRGGSRKAIQ